VRAVGAEAVKLGDERRRAVETALDHGFDIAMERRVPHSGGQRCRVAAASADPVQLNPLGDKWAKLAGVA